MKTATQRFCPICKTYHDPNVVCTDRTGELLRAAGIEPKPMAEKEFKETTKKANRSLLLFVLVVVLVGILLTVLLAEIKR